MGSTPSDVPMLLRHRSAWGLFDICPFCTETGAWLSMAGVSFQTRRPSLSELHQQKWRLPILQHRGLEVHEAPRIVAYVARAFAVTLDEKLTAPQRMWGAALRSSLSEGLYWAIIQARWFEPSVMKAYEEIVFDTLTPEQREFIPSVAREAQRKELAAQSAGRLSAEERYAAGCETLKGLASHFAESDFVLGSEPTSFDAAAYAFVAHVVRMPFAGPLTDCARSLTPLHEYLARMQQRFVRLDQPQGEP